MSTPDTNPPQLPEDPNTPRPTPPDANPVPPAIPQPASFADTPPPVPGASGSFLKGPLTPFPTPSETDRSWAIGLHACPLIGLILPLGNLLAPFVLWLIKKPESAYLDEVGKEVVNYQISITIYALVCTVIAFITCGIGTILFLPLVLAWLIFVIIGVIKTSNGEPYRYPATIRLIK